MWNKSGKWYRKIGRKRDVLGEALRRAEEVEARWAGSAAASGGIGEGSWSSPLGPQPADHRPSQRSREHTALCTKGGGGADPRDEPSKWRTRKVLWVLGTLREPPKWELKTPRHTEEAEPWHEERIAPMVSHFILKKQGKKMENSYLTGQGEIPRTVPANQDGKQQFTSRTQWGRNGWRNRREGTSVEVKGLEKKQERNRGKGPGGRASLD